MIVVDASAAVDALLNAGQARDTLAGNALAAPHLVDVEVLSAFRRQTQAKLISLTDARSALDTWRHLEIERHAIRPLTEEIWKLRTTLSAYDATYVALAAALELSLLTADMRLARAADGHYCEVVTVEPH